MKIRALTLVVLMLTVGTIGLFGEPRSNKECCTPQPVGGIEALEQNTIYPLLADRYGAEGDVIVKFVVNEAGQVSNISVQSSGGKLFDQSAIDAIKTTKWHPAMQNGEPVAVAYSQEFNYRIN
ncbi:MAG: energy transducer TonB [Candidatus Marinimicrobia bacterium]|nr:energy transducer TonB [Candidatus Neomarinimicrobiota bacterium]